MSSQAEEWGLEGRLSSDDPFIKLEALSSLCEALTFDTTVAHDMGLFPPSQILPLIIPLICKQSEVESINGNSFEYFLETDDWVPAGEVTLQALRCIQLYFESAPISAVTIFINAGGCSRLVWSLTPEMLTQTDLIDPVVQCIAVIARDRPCALSTPGGPNALVALVANLPFFSLPVQVQPAIL